MAVPLTSTIPFPLTLEGFRELSPETVAELARHTRPLALRAGQILFRQGEPFKNAVYVIEQGAMELQRPGESPVTLEAGEILGIVNYFDNTPYLSTARAVSDIKLYALPAEKLREAEQRHPEIAAVVNRMVTAYIRRHATHPVTGVWALPARAIMKSPLVTGTLQMTAREAFDTMKRRQIGSLGIIDGDQRLLGMLTFVTLAQGLISGDAEANQPILDTLCEPANSISSDAPLWKVQNEQTRLGAKYLVVTENQKPVGIVSQTDVLYTIVSYQRSIFAQVNDIDTLAELQEFVGGQIGKIGRELRQHNRSAGLAVRALSEIHLAIQRRCIDLVLKEMEGEGKPAPAAPYALIIMGSGGRKEMMIKTDQDNGIILADSPEIQAPGTREWFMDFCDRINHRLDELGYDWCTGDIMARNPDYHKTLTEWRDYISRIAEVPSEKRARWSNMFFDFETLYGDDRLAIALRHHVITELAHKPRLLKHMVEDDAQGGPALGFFNRLVTATDKERKGKIDLKRNGTRLLDNAARIYALSEGIADTNTSDRLRALVRQGRLDSDFVESVLAAYDEILDITLGHQLTQMEQGKPLDKLLDPGELTPLAEESLRMAMRIIKRLQGRMQGEFGTVML